MLDTIVQNRFTLFFQEKSSADNWLLNGKGSCAMNSRDSSEKVCKEIIEVK